MMGMDTKLYQIKQRKVNKLQSLLKASKYSKIEAENIGSFC